MDKKRLVRILKHLLDNGVQCKTESIPTSEEDDFKIFLQSMEEAGYIEAKIRPSRGSDDYDAPLDVVIFSVTKKGIILVS